MRKIQLLSTVIAAAAIMTFSSAKAQFGLGAQLATQNWAATASIPSPTGTSIAVPPTFGFGIGIQGYYNLGDKMRISLNADYIFPAKKSTPDLLGGTPTDVTVGNFAISPNFQYAFVGNLNEEGFVFYGLAGIDVNMYSYKMKGSTMTFDSASFSFVSSDLTASKSYVGFTPHIGIGLEYGLSESTRLFLEARYAFGKKLDASDLLANLLSGSPVPSSYNPSYIGIDLGVRFGMGGK